MLGGRLFFLIPIVAATVHAAPFSLGTGTAAWQVQQTAVLPAGNGTNTGGALNVSSAAAVLSGALPFSSLGWIFAPPGTAWVGQLSTDGGASPGGVLTPGTGAAPGVYAYTLTFAAGTAGFFSLNYTADNNVGLTVVQGVNTLYSASAPAITDQYLSLISTGTINFGAGSNVVITATVTNLPSPTSVDTARNPSGFLVSGIGDTVPEPSTLAMLALGMGSLAVTRLRRK